MHRLTALLVLLCATLHTAVSISVSDGKRLSSQTLSCYKHDELYMHL